MVQIEIYKNGVLHYISGVYQGIEVLTSAVTNKSYRIHLN